MRFKLYGDKTAAFTNNQTFNEWLAEHPHATAYQRRIVRLHALYPDATLSQLRGHAKKMSTS